VRRQLKRSKYLFAAVFLLIAPANAASHHHVRPPSEAAQIAALEAKIDRLTAENKRLRLLIAPPPPVPTSEETVRPKNLTQTENAIPDIAVIPSDTTLTANDALEKTMDAPLVVVNTKGNHWFIATIIGRKDDLFVTEVVHIRRGGVGGGFIGGQTAPVSPVTMPYTVMPDLAAILLMTDKRFGGYGDAETVPVQQVLLSPSKITCIQTLTQTTFIPAALSHPLFDWGVSHKRSTWNLSTSWAAPDFDMSRLKERFHSVPDNSIVGETR
jgi:hypothetical protein